MPTMLAFVPEKFYALLEWILNISSLYCKNKYAVDEYLPLLHESTYCLCHTLPVVMIVVAAIERGN